jgi:hypothetical protein
LGGAAKVDCFVKLDVLSLIEQGRRRGRGKWDQAVDQRSAGDIIRNPRGAISIFKCPDGWFAQEPRFVPKHAGRNEDSGYLLSYCKLSGLASGKTMLTSSV